MARLGIVGALVIVSQLAGCAYVGVPGSAPSPSMQPGAPPTEPAPSPTETAPAVTPTPEHETAAPSPTDSPSPTPTLPPPSHAAGREASNRFWERWYQDCWFGAFPISSSVADITSQSDLIVRGTISDIYTRTTWAHDWQPAYLSVSVSEVLKGDPRVRAPGLIEVQIGFWGTDLQEFRSNLPAHEHVLFLVHKSTLESNPQARDSYTYFPTDYPQVSVLRGIGGVVLVITPKRISDAYSPSHFPLPLEGLDFEEFVDRVRKLSAPQGGSAIAARWIRPEHPGDLIRDAC